MAEFILAPNARWQGRNQTGEPCAFGKLYTYINGTTTPKATYQDYEGLQPNTNPVILDGKGEANVYWATDELYTIKLFTSDDQEVYTQDDYPVTEDDSSEIVEDTAINTVRNPQFYFWYYGTDFSPVAGSGSQSNVDYICDDWLYSRTDTTYTVNITRQTFELDQTAVPNNPTYFFRYATPSAPSTETNNRLYQRYENVQAFANSSVVLSLYAKSPTSSTISVYLVQDFGTSGSPSTSVETLVLEADLSTDWARYSGVVTLPDLTGKTVGTDGNSALILRINFPDDIAATVDLCNVQLQQGTSLTDFPYETLDNQEKELDNRVILPALQTGFVVPTIKTTALDGWLMCEDQTIGNVGSGADDTGLSMRALFNLIWNNVSNNFAPIYTSAGALTTRGASADDDWYALKRLALTKILGRVIASAGAAEWSKVFTADAGTDLLTVGTGGDSFTTVTPVTLTTTGTLPAPLATATTYYCRQASASTFYLATTAANAIDNSIINITDAGTGTHTVTIDYTSFSLGAVYGEEQHGLIISQMPAHTHPGTANISGNVAGGAPSGITFGANDQASNLNVTLTVASQGGSSGFHVYQPTVYLRFMIKL